MTESRPYAISLRLSHPTRRAEELAPAVRLSLQLAWSAGDRRTTRTGHDLAGVRAQSCWMHPFELPAGAELEKGLQQVLDRLAPHRNCLRELANDGGTVELFIGYFLPSKNCGFVLDPALLQQVVDLGTALSFDIYAPA